MADVLLQVQDLTVSYRGRAVVDSVSVELARGRCLGVIGESGAGKSQAFLALMGLCDADARVQGRALLAGEDLIANAEGLRGRRVGMIFQDPLTSLTPHLRVGEQIGESLRLHRGLGRAEARAEAGRLLDSVRVNEVERRLDQFPHELSGGMRQRVMIAIALASNPELLIADEPTTALDVSVQAQFLALLRLLVVERALTLVVITHDMGVISALADDVMVMRGGRVVDRGPVAAILDSPTHEYTRQLVAAAPRMEDEVEQRNAPSPPPDEYARDATSFAARGVQVRHSLRIPLFSKFRLPARRRPPGALTAVDGVSLRVSAGESVGIVGESGCGKSSLVRALLRLHDVSAGEIVWLGRQVQNLRETDLRSLRPALQMVFQDPVASLDPLQNVSDIVAEPLRALRPGMDASERASRVRAVLDSVGLGAEFDTRRRRTLSGGQCQRVAIARALVLEPKLLVCDEAVSSLDVSIQAQLLELFEDIRRRGTGILFVSHNLAVVRRLCQRVLVMYLGRVVESGPTDVVLARPHHPYTRMLLESVPLLDPARERRRLAALVSADAPRGGEGVSAVDRPAGCAFHARCPSALPACAATNPGTESAAEQHEVACLRWRDIVKSVPV